MDLMDRRQVDPDLGFSSNNCYPVRVGVRSTYELSPVSAGMSSGSPELIVRRFDVVGEEVVGAE